ncbi:hypothetical protein BG57_28380 [Caballeronia grimmiae]|jgi:hypothetical protein|uniref:Uncharacterized protein n=1 Tax=Caballeronia grimmiae TaxID=1071679 RepID=A0A069NDI4_9BURK|nr:hypothetical protein BG57_28380 [Caballeronia grimmiae]
MRIIFLFVGCCRRGLDDRIAFFSDGVRATLLARALRDPVQEALVVDRPFIDIGIEVSAQAA